MFVVRIGGSVRILPLRQNDIETIDLWKLFCIRYALNFGLSDQFDVSPACVFWHALHSGVKNLDMSYCAHGQEARIKTLIRHERRSIEKNSDYPTQHSASWAARNCKNCWNELGSGECNRSARQAAQTSQRMTMAKKRRQPLEPLEAIKRLLILILAKQGTTSEEIGKVLEIDPSAIRRIVSFRTKKPKRP